MLHHIYNGLLQPAIKLNNGQEQCAIGGFLDAHTLLIRSKIEAKRDASASTLLIIKLYSMSVEKLIFNQPSLGRTFAMSQKLSWTVVES